MGAANTRNASLAVRRALATAILLALLAAPPALARLNTAGQTLARLSTAGQTSRHALATSVLAQLNAIRTGHGLVPLKPNAALATAATAHSGQMLTDGYFTHDSFDGSPFWKRLSGYTNGSERILVCRGEPRLVIARHRCKEAIQLWMASAEHRQNILTASWREIGVPAIHADSAPGTYGGRPVTVITTDCGVRR